MKKMDRYVDYVVKELYDLTKIDYDNQKILILKNNDLIGSVSFKCIFKYSSIDIMRGGSLKHYDSVYKPIIRNMNDYVLNGDIKKKVLCKYLSKVYHKIDESILV
jgi:hypothetical protein